MTLHFKSFFFLQLLLTVLKVVVPRQLRRKTRKSNTPIRYFHLKQFAKPLLTAGLGTFLLLFSPVIYGTRVGPGLVHLPAEFKVSKARKNTMTGIKLPK